jgi:hypothetical protein
MQLRVHMARSTLAFQSGTSGGSFIPFRPVNTLKHTPRVPLVSLGGRTHMGIVKQDRQRTLRRGGEGGGVRGISTRNLARKLAHKSARACEHAKLTKSQFDGGGGGNRRSGTSACSPEISKRRILETHACRMNKRKKAKVQRSDASKKGSPQTHLEANLSKLLDQLPRLLGRHPRAFATEQVDAIDPL